MSRLKENNRIIFIEDDKKKIEDVKSYLSETFDYHELVVRESYQSGLRELFKNNYDLLLLDMSIPMWDRTTVEPGFNFQKFGGYMILNEITRKKKPVKTILVTMFDDFGESDGYLTLKELDGHLGKKFEEIYVGAVFYSSKESSWKDQLGIYINDVIV